MPISTAYWCVLIAALQPYLWAYIAKLPAAGAERFDNHDPRGWLARQPHSRVQRANAAQHNSFEAFAPFAAGVVLAQLAGVEAGRIALLAAAFVGLRFFYGLCYLVDWAALRSLTWAAGFACVIALHVQAASQIDALSILQARQ